MVTPRWLWAIPGVCRATRAQDASCSRASPGSCGAGWAVLGRAGPRPQPSAARCARAPSGLWREEMAVSRKEWIWGSAWLQAHLPSIKMLFFKTNKQKIIKQLLGKLFSWYGRNYRSSAAQCSCWYFWAHFCLNTVLYVSQICYLFMQHS